MMVEKTNTDGLQAVKGFVVALDQGIPAGEGNAILNAIRALQHVVGVESIGAEYRDQIVTYRTTARIFAKVENACRTEVGRSWVSERDDGIAGHRERRLAWSAKKEMLLVIERVCAQHLGLTWEGLVAETGIGADAPEMAE